MRVHATACAVAGTDDQHPMTLFSPLAGPLLAQRVTESRSSDEGLIQISLFRFVAADYDHGLGNHLFQVWTSAEYHERTVDWNYIYNFIYADILRNLSGSSLHSSEHSAVCMLGLLGLLPLLFSGCDCCFGSFFPSLPSSHPLKYWVTSIFPITHWCYLASSCLASHKCLHWVGKLASWGLSALKSLRLSFSSLLHTLSSFFL